MLTSSGFWFGNRPNVNLHVSKLCQKFRSMLWTLRRLRRSGMSAEDLLTVYKTIHRAMIDFASPTYHPLLTATQSDQIEQLQRRALKIVYGHEISYKNCLELAQIPLLSERRSKLALNFALKTSNNPKFSDGWFPKKPLSNHYTRNPQTYLEPRARTERMRRNPINYMRRELNNM